MVERTFRGASLRDAMGAVHQQMGPDAVIVTTRRVHGDAGGGGGFEVVARGTMRRPVATAALQGAAVRKLGVQRPLRADAAGRAGADMLRVDGAAARSARRSATMVELLGELAALRDAVGAVREVARRGVDAAETWSELRREIEGLTHELAPAGADTRGDDPEVRRLVSLGIEAPIARALAYRASGKAVPAGGLAVAKVPDLAAEVAAAIPTTAPLWARDGRTVAALVGPSGAGKTHVLTKIAWTALREHGRRVAIVAADAHRVGRVEVLRELGERLRIPIRLARTRHDISAALAELGDRDLVLIDTPGCCPHNDQALFGLDSLLEIPHVERHLVVPATWRSTELQELVRRFSRIHVGAMTLTKLDEARGFAAALSSTWESRIPLGHISSGQRIPDDIAAADGRELAQRILVAAA